MEITTEITLSPEEKQLLVLHSVLNVMNVIVYNFVRLENAYGTRIVLQDLEKKLFTLSKSLGNPDAEASVLDTLQNFPRTIFVTLDALSDELGRGLESMDLFNEVSENLKSILEIMGIRIRELLARSANPMAWGEFDTNDLEYGYVQVLSAIEKNSLGSYRIVFNLAEHEAGHYLINFHVGSRNNKTIFMPMVFQDIVRDLLANARKYTNPGGKIEGGLYDFGNEIRLVVEDTGRGIPKTEIDKLIQFGVRASNVKDISTRGGGFGLTKAYYFTKEFKGRFWIESEIDRGTRIEIRIPKADIESLVDTR